MTATMLLSLVPCLGISLFAAAAISWLDRRADREAEALLDRTIDPKPLPKGV